MTPPRPLYRPRKLERVEVAWKDAQADSVYDGTVEGYADTSLPTLEDIGYFVKLDKEVFSQKPFIDYASKSLVLLKVDFPRKTKLQPGVAQQNRKLSETYKVEGFPTVLLLDAEGNVLGKTGYEEGGAGKYVESLKALLKKK